MFVVEHPFIRFDIDYRHRLTLQSPDGILLVDHLAAVQIFAGQPARSGQHQPVGLRRQQADGASLRPHAARQQFDDGLQHGIEIQGRVDQLGNRMDFPEIINLVFELDTTLARVLIVDRHRSRPCNSGGICLPRQLPLRR
ncbi:MAG: hypothetical protein ACD_75C00245G0001 [uncultured bacterium]|nr:MAG: hypothetical protein ACD_75C00245G0001 [uncultured bacterium]